MKTTLGICVTLAILSAACGDEEKGKSVTAPGPAPVSTQTEPPPTTAPARRLVTKTAMTTSTENLVTDPDFQSLWTALDETGYGIYESYAIDARAEVRFVPQSPVGPEGAALSVTADGADASITMMVLGAKGPLAASLWVSASEGEEPEVQIAALYDSTMVSLTPDTAAAQTHGGVRWVPYRATLAQDLPGTIYFSITPTGKKAFTIVAPEVRPAAQQDRHRARRVVPATRAVLRGIRALEAVRASHQTMSLPPRVGLKKINLRVKPIVR
jgi:hypothetical protein